MSESVASQALRVANHTNNFSSNPADYQSTTKASAHYALSHTDLDMRWTQATAREEGRLLGPVGSRRLSALQSKKFRSQDP